MNGNLTILSTQNINDIATYLGLPDSNDTDRLLNWCEDTFPQVCAPARQLTQQFGPYTYRFYPATGLFVATKDGSVFVLNSRTTGANPSNVGTLRSFLDLMPSGR